MASLHDRAPATSDFARMAERLIAAGDFTAAEALCLRGVAAFPTYATGYLMLGRARLMAGAPDEALAAAQQGLRCAPGSAALHALVRDCGHADRVAVDDEETRELRRLAAQLEGARMPAADAAAPLGEEIAPRTELPVTPTLARIYEQQGLIDEALAAYRALAEQHDAMQPHYEERIAALRARLRDRKGK